MRSMEKLSLKSEKMKNSISVISGLITATIFLMGTGVQAQIKGKHFDKCSSGTFTLMEGLDPTGVNTIVYEGRWQQGDKLKFSLAVTEKDGEIFALYGRKDTSCSLSGGGMRTSEITWIEFKGATQTGIQTSKDGKTAIFVQKCTQFIGLKQRLKYSNIQME